MEMTLHIFNPEHDIALASGLSNFTAPHAGRQLRHDLGFLPAILAGEGDVILVDDAEQAARLWQKAAHRAERLLGRPGLAAKYLSFESARLQIGKLQASQIEPWGWNVALRSALLRQDADERLLPTTEQLDTMRQLSHRRTAAALLPKLRQAGTVGEAFECRKIDEVYELLSQYEQVVLKAPWSSSGRGVRFCDAQHLNGQMGNEQGWLRNVLSTQGSVMVEPYYNKVKDFGMEFVSDGKGKVSFLGLSLFHTANGAYTGNVLAIESVKREIISRYLSMDLLDSIQEKICTELGEVYDGKYCGPFGVDMMVCAPAGQKNSDEIGKNEGFLLHPCVEINLRRTMGHVALALAPKDDDIRCVMRIDYTENCYKLTINRL